jgi:hypothetical protein
MLRQPPTIALLRRASGMSGQMRAISSVLPLKAYGRRYIDDPGRCHVLLTSLATFAPDDMFEDIFVVVPPASEPMRKRSTATGNRCRWSCTALQGGTEGSNPSPSSGESDAN